MSSAKLCHSKNSIIMSWLARELKRDIPELDLYGQERSLLDFAYNDLKTCLKSKWRDINSHELEEALMAKDRQEELKEFLKVWTPQWLEKWRERVTLCQELPHLSLGYLEAKKKAAKLFKRMENRQELKKLIELKLINEGEVCMAELIAENLIIEEIVHRLKMKKGKTPTDMEQWSIYQAVLHRIKRLTERRAPIIHLKLMRDV